MRPASGEIEKVAVKDNDDLSDVTVTELRMEWVEEVTHPDGRREMRSRSLRVGRSTVKVVPVVLTLALLLVLVFRPDLFEAMSNLLTKVLTRAG